MSYAIAQYLRTYRKRVGFTQREVASLLGVETEHNVSRYERLARRPNLETALACQVIFNVPAQELFPGLYREVEQGVRKRADQILKDFDKKNGERPASRKRAVLEALASAHK